MLINSRGTCLCKSSYQYCSVGESKLCVYFPLFSPVHSVQNKQMPNTLYTFFNFSLFDLNADARKNLAAVLFHYIVLPKAQPKYIHMRSKVMRDEKTHFVA